MTVSGHYLAAILHRENHQSSLRQTKSHDQPPFLWLSHISFVSHQPSPMQAKSIPQRWWDSTLFKEFVELIVVIEDRGGLLANEMKAVEMIVLMEKIINEYISDFSLSFNECLWC